MIYASLYDSAIWLDVALNERHMPLLLRESLMIARQSSIRLKYAQHQLDHWTGITLVSKHCLIPLPPGKTPQSKQGKQKNKISK